MTAAIAPPERIGFVGLGNMGGPMARRLAQSGYRLTVADASEEAVARYRASLDAKTPCDAADLVAVGRCPVVITMLPDGHAVRKVLLDKHGMVSTLAADSIVIDMSSSSPVGTRELAVELGRHRIVLIDAPVSGGVRKALDGTLAIMAGGDALAIERCRGLLEILGNVFATGPSGSGHAMKALNNYLSAANLAVAAEAVIAGQRFGLDPATMISILNASTGRNSATDQKYPAYVLPRNFASGFALGLMAKDLKLAVEVACATGSPAQLLGACAHMWAEAERQLGGRADNTEIVRYLELLAERSQQ